MSNYREASCPECSGKYVLTPPADPNYNVPKEKKASDDYQKRDYKCDLKSHNITIYWQRSEDDFRMSSSPPASDKPYTSTKYGRQSQG